MTTLLWSAVAALVLVVSIAVLHRMGRVARVRATVLEEVRRALRGGIIETLRGRGPQARGRLGQLEITVDLYSDPARSSQSPMWRVLAVGPVRLEHPLEVHVAGWRGWIDPWLQLGETVSVPGNAGPELAVHAEDGIRLDHPVIAALRRQGTGLGPGALLARPDLMRAEVGFGPRHEDNRQLFTYLHAMGEISDLPAQSAVHRHGPAGAHIRRPEAVPREIR